MLTLKDTEKPTVPRRKRTSARRIKCHQARGNHERPHRGNQGGTPWLLMKGVVRKETARNLKVAD